MTGIPINYVGDSSILTNPLYLKYSLKTVDECLSAVADIKSDLKKITANMENLNIIAYLSNLLRAVALVA